MVVPEWTSSCHRVWQGLCAMEVYAKRTLHFALCAQAFESKRLDMRVAGVGLAKYKLHFALHRILVACLHDLKKYWNEAS